MKHLFCDCKTDEEKANFFLSGRAVETGIIAPAISNDVAMAYHRCAEFQKEIDTLRAKIEAMGRQKPVAWLHETRRDSDVVTDAVKHVWGKAVVGALAAYSIPLYLAPGVQPAPSALAEAIIADMQAQHDSELITENDSGEALIRLDGAIAAVEDNFALAQPAPIIPEGWKLVPTAESRHPGIYKMLGALHTVDNTPGASEWESYAAFLAAAPEAKP